MVPFHALPPLPVQYLSLCSTLDCICCLKTGLSPHCLWSPLLHSRPWPHSLEGDEGPWDWGHHWQNPHGVSWGPRRSSLSGRYVVLRIKSSGSRQPPALGIRGYSKTREQKPGAKQREKSYWEPSAGVLLPPRAFFFFPMVKLYMLFEHQFSYLQSGVLTCLFFPPALHENVNSTEAGINFSFNLQSHSSHSIPPGSLLGTIHTCWKMKWV